MKNLYSLLICCVCAALAVMTLFSCSKGEALEPENTLNSQSGKEIPDWEIVPFASIYCTDPSGVIAGNSLVVGRPYEFTAVPGAISIDDVPQIIIMLKDDSGLLMAGMERIQKTFTTPGRYTVEAQVTLLSGSGTCTRIFEVRPAGVIDIQAELKVPFTLPVNGSKYDEVSLQVTESVFNEPKYTATRVDGGDFQVSINEPGAYEFSVVINGQVDAVYKAQIFIKPDFVFNSRPMNNGSGEYYNNIYIASTPGPGGLEIFWLFGHRFFCECNEIDVRSSKYSIGPTFTLYGDPKTDGCVLPFTGYKMNGICRAIPAIPGRYFLITYPDENQTTLPGVDTGLEAENVLNPDL